MSVFCFYFSYDFNIIIIAGLWFYSCYDHLYTVQVCCYDSNNDFI